MRNRIDSSRRAPRVGLAVAFVGALGWPGWPAAETRIGGRRVAIHYERREMTAWATDAAGSLLTSVLASEEGWIEFHPDSRLFTAEADPRRPGP